ncbi:EAL domain-containing protein [Nitrosospira lacus]|uniref:bifunctional diguanylate cyclase/phosphodiesterase n=1 Tax=Nitrosospira lacus TaxID=1288494 RepID=UPI00137481AB|nr:EAL domain-containing protein [Nitrosospira lacus]
MTFAVFLSLTLVSWSVVRDLQERDANNRFDNRLADVISQIQTSFSSYDQVLKGALGHLLASEFVTRDEWRKYVSTLRLGNNPAILGLGFAKSIRPDEMHAHLASIRAEGFPTYRVWPESPREEYTSIVYLEPFSGKNMRALGYDMYSHPVRRAAMSRARDSGETTLSGKIRLVQETEADGQEGVLMYTPYYGRGNLPETLEQRRASLVGYVYAPFRMDDFIGAVLRAELDDLDIRIFDTQSVAQDFPLFDSSKNQPVQSSIPQFRKTITIPVYGQTWTIDVTSRPQFEHAVASQEPWLVLLGGIVVSILTAMVVFMLAVNREKIDAIRQANKELLSAIKDQQAATLELSNSKQRTQRILESITDAFFTLDREWRFTYLNKEAETLLEQNRSILLGKNVWEEFKEAVGSTFEREFHRALHENASVAFEDFYSPLGKWFEVHAYPSEEGLAVYFRDITERKRSETEREKLYQEKLLLLESTGKGIYGIDLEGRCMFINSAAAHMLGYAVSDLLGQHMHALTHNRRADGTIYPVEQCAILQTLRIQRPSHADDDVFWRKDGRCLPVEFTSHPIVESGETTGTVVIFSDITQRKDAELARREADARIREQASLLDKAKDAIIVRSINHHIQFWNQGAERLYGWTLEEVNGKSIENILYDDSTAFHEAMQLVLRDDEWRGELTQRRKDGSTLITEGHWTLVRDDKDQPQSILTINTDITQRKAAEDEIHHLAFYDSLTQLPNRQLLLDRLQQALAASARSHNMGALLFIDLDNFKTLNDTLGHDTGDLLLRQVAPRLVSCVRENDTVARLGGDEFVVVLTGDLGSHSHEAVAQIKMICERILAAFTEPFHLGAYEHHSTPSIGVALFNDQPTTLDELLKRADLAMYQAKASGRNAMCFFDPDMQEVVNVRVVLESDLRRGLEKKEFLLHYQPQVDGNGRVTGAEALVRWQHSRRGLLPPAEFIPHAEESGLIYPLGHWVLETACSQLSAWSARPETARLNMAINVSPRQFRHPDFVDQVLSALDHTGADPQKLKLELTENLLVHNVEDIIAKMATLKTRGVGFALDDFGTGYSSLYYLKRLPLGWLKIDQSFIRELLTDPHDATIVRAILVLAKSMGLSVIAEGVETNAQKSFLAQHGCDAYQGYLFSRPLTFEQFEVFYSRKDTA